MEVLAKDIIVTWLLPHLPFPSTGRCSRVAPAEVVSASLYKLKTGCQWRWLPVAAFFSGEPLTWQGVYYYFYRCSRQDAWKTLWLTNALFLADNQGQPLAVDKPQAGQHHARFSWKPSLANSATRWKKRTYA